MDKNIQVSVVIPVHNGANYIQNAVDSALVQNVSMEILIIDDASSDKLIERLEKYGISKGEEIQKIFITDEKTLIYIRNKKNLGVAESRNIGIRLAKGNYIAFLDADDWWRENKLVRQIALIEQKKVNLVYTGRALYSEQGISLGKKIKVPEIVSYKQLLTHNCISCSSVLLKTETAKEIEMSNSEIHEDYLMWLRILSKYGLAAGIDEPLLNYRLTVNGKSRNKLKSAKMTFGVYRKLNYGVPKAFFFTVSHLVHGIIKYR